MEIGGSILFIGSRRGGAYRSVANTSDILFFAILSFMRWAVQTLNSIVDTEIKALPADMQAQFLRFAEMIEQVGFESLPRQSVRHLEGKLWELRMIGRDIISRAIYITAAGRRVVVVRIFIKKTQKTPQRELQLARQRAKEII